MKKIKVGDWVMMNKKGRKEHPRLKSYSGVIEEIEKVGWCKIRRYGIVYRGETAGHWWDLDHWNLHD